MEIEKFQDQVTNHSTSLTSLIDTALEQEQPIPFLDILLEEYSNLCDQEVDNKKKLLWGREYNRIEQAKELFTKETKKPRSTVIALFEL